MASRPRLNLVLGMAACVVAGVHIFRPNAANLPHAEFEAIDTGGLPELRSRNGLLDATLTAAPLMAHIGNVTFAGAGYNGVYGGPVIRVRRGDLLRLHLINRMPNVINLHFHGLRVSPEGHGDNMHIRVLPGRQFDYEIRIPWNHPPGLFWYHDHAPDLSEPHVNAGLSGALLIDGFAAQFGGLNSIEQKLIVLKDWTGADCTGMELKTALHCRIVSINGGSNWASHMVPNGAQLWRISNQGANLSLHLAAPGLTFRVIGRDGLPANDGVAAEKVDIMPASRVDVLVRAKQPGEIVVFATGVPTGRGEGFSTRRVLGHVAVAGAPAHPIPDLVLPRFDDLRSAQISARRMIIFAQDKNATRYTINGQTYNERRVDLRAQMGSVEEWTVQNMTPDFHEFHIHQLGFQVVEINHASVPFGGFVDDVSVPQHGEVKLLVPFTDPLIAGHIMFHCHVLNHEDRGMMATLEIVTPGLFHICRWATP